VPICGSGTGPEQRDFSDPTDATDSAWLSQTAMPSGVRMGRAGIEPATLGLKEAARRFGGPRERWNHAVGALLNAGAFSAILGGLCCPHVAPQIRLV
jgi:hypothetical protein